MIAKAEVLQAAIGVSCNEQDLQDCLIGTAAAPSNEASSELTSCDAVVPGSTRHEKLANEKDPSLFKETDEPDAANLGGGTTEGSQAATAAGLVLQEDKPYR